MSQLKIVYKHGDPPHAEITVDGKPFFVDNVDIFIDATSSRAVITVYDIDLEYEGPTEVKKVPL